MEEDKRKMSAAGRPAAAPGASSSNASASAPGASSSTFDERLRRKMEEDGGKPAAAAAPSSAASSASATSAVGRDAFDERLRKKTAEETQQKTKETQTPGRGPAAAVPGASSSTASHGVNSSTFDERLRRKMEEDDGGKPAAAAPPSAESSASAASAPIDSFDERLRKKMGAEESQKQPAAAAAPTDSSSSFDQRLREKLEGEQGDRKKPPAPTASVPGGDVGMPPTFDERLRRKMSREEKREDSLDLEEGNPPSLGAEAEVKDATAEQTAVDGEGSPLGPTVVTSCGAVTNSMCPDNINPPTPFNYAAAKLSIENEAVNAPSDRGAHHVALPGGTGEALVQNNENSASEERRGPPEMPSSENQPDSVHFDTSRDSVHSANPPSESEQQEQDAIVAVAAPRKPSISSTSSIPVLEAYRVEDAMEGPVYDAVPVENDDAGHPWWRKYQKYLVIGLLIALAVAVGVAVSLGSGSSSNEGESSSNNGEESNESAKKSVKEGVIDKCQGGCDDDLDCKGGLRCFKRESDTAAFVPYCGENETIPGENYCTERGVEGDDLWLVEVANQLDKNGGMKNDGTSIYDIPLGLCEGDCDYNIHCQAGLYCFQRGRRSTNAMDAPVPGCWNEGGVSGEDYCAPLPYTSSCKELYYKAVSMIQGYDDDLVFNFPRLPDAVVGTSPNGEVLDVVNVKVFYRGDFGYQRHNVTTQSSFLGTTANTYDDELRSCDGDFLSDKFSIPLSDFNMYIDNEQYMLTITLDSSEPNDRIHNCTTRSNARVELFYPVGVCPN